MPPALCPWPPRSSTRWWSRGNSPPTCSRGKTSQKVSALSPVAFRWGSMTQQSRHGHCALTRCSWGIPPQPWQSRTPFAPRKCLCLNPSTSWAHDSRARVWCWTWSLVTPHLLLRNFCIAEWPLMEASLHAMGDDHTPVLLPSMLRWVQLQMAAYFQGVSSHRHLLPPRFEYLHDVVQQCTFHLLPPMPSCYITTTTPAAAPLSSGNPPTNPNPSTPGNSGGAAESSPSNRDLGQRVANPSPIKQFTQAYTGAQSIFHPRQCTQHH